MPAHQIRWRLNVRFTAAFFGLLLLACAVLYFWHGMQVDRSTQLLLERAQAQERESQWDDLVRTLRLYLQVAPDDDKAWTMLANAEVQRAKTFEQKDGAARVLGRVLARPGLTKDVALRLKLARLDYEAGRAADAVDESVKVQRQGDADQVREAKIIEALAAHDRLLFGATPSDGAWNEAREKLESALPLSPSLNDDVEMVADLARIYWDENIVLAGAAQDAAARQARAKELMDALVQRWPDDAASYLTRYRFRTIYGLEGAQEDLEAAIARAKDDSLEVWLSAGEGTLRSAQGDPKSLERARDYFAKVVAVAPEDRRGYLGMIRAYVMLEGAAPNGKSVEAAEQVVQQALEKIGPDDFELKLWQARIYESTRQDSKLQQALQDLDKIRGENQLRWSSAFHMLAQAEVDRLRAEDFMNRSDYAAAAAKLEELSRLELRLPSGAASQVNWAISPAQTWGMLGECRESLGESDRAARAYEQALAILPTPAYLRATARAWTAAGRADLAAPYLERLGESVASAGGMAQLESTVSGLARLAAEDRDWTEVKRQLAEYEQDPATKLRARLLAARISALENDPAAANKSLADAEATPPKTPEEWRALIVAYAATNADADVERCLQKYAGQATASEVALLRGDLLILKQQPAAAERVLKQALDAAKGQEKYTLCVALARLLSGQSRLTEAREVLAQAGKGEGVPYRQALRLSADIALATKDWAAMQQAETELQALDGAEGTEAKYVQARRLLASSNGDLAQVKRAADLSAELTKLRPDWLDAVELTALVSEANGETEEAVRAYERALVLAAGTPAEARMGSRYVELSMKAAGANGMLAAPVETRIAASRELSAMAISRAVAAGNVKLALKLAAKSAENFPNDPQALYWQGQVTALSGDLESASQILARASRFAPGSALVWDAYLSALSSAGRVADVETVITQLKTNTAMPEPARSLLVARAQATVGDTLGAAKTYEELTRKHPDNSEVNSAAVSFYLTRDVERATLLARAASAAAPNDPKLKRQLALAVAASGALADFDEAATLLGAAGGQLPTEEVDQRLYAQLLTKRPEPELRRKGIEILATLADRKSSVASQERLDLVRLHEEDGNHAAALRELSIILERAPLVAPEHLATFVNYVVNHYDAAAPSERKAAEAAVEQLEKLEGDSWRTFALGLRLERLRDGELKIQSPVDFPAVIRERVASGMPMATTPQQKAALLANAAQLCMDFGDQAAAEDYYRKAAAEHASGKLALAGYLAQRDVNPQVDEAIDLCIAAAPEVGDLAAARALCMVLAIGGVNDAQAKRGEEWLAPLLEKYSSDAGLQFAWSSYCLMRGNQPAAVKSLQEVLKLAPDNALARNNLAFLLVGEGKPDESLRQVELAMAIAGPTRSFRDTLGLALLAKNDTERAKKTFEQLVAVAPEDVVFKLHLAAAQLASGSDAEAKATLQLAESAPLHESKLPASDRERLASLRTKLGLGGATP